MTIPLVYDISTIGEDRIKRVLRGVESEVKASASRTDTAARQVGRRRGAISPEDRQAARGFDQIGKAARAADARIYRERERLERRDHALKERNIAARLRNELAATKAADRAKMSAIKTFARGAATTTVNRATTVAGLGAGLAVGAVASRLGSAVSLDKAQRALVVAGRGAGQESPLDLKAVQEKTQRVSLQTGTSQADVVQGMRDYVTATGDLKGASDNITSFATIAVAAEASIGDVAKAGAYLAKSMGVTAADMPKALATFYFQGKKGAFELRDIATAVPELGAMAKGMGMSGMEGVRTLGGLSQIAMEGTGNAAEAQTALANLFRQTVAKSEKAQSGELFSGRKVEIFKGGDPTKEFNDFREVIANMVVASRGNIVQLNDFAEIRGSKALNPLVNTYKDAVAAVGSKATQKQKDDAGRAAVLAKIADSSDATGEFGDVQRDAQDAMKSTASQLEMLNTKLTAIAQSTLLPALVKLGPPIERLIPTLGRLIEKLAAVIDWAAAHPGEAVVAALVAQIAAAGVSTAISSALAGLITKMAVGSMAAPGAVAGVLGLGGNAAAGALGMGAAGAGGLALAGGGLLAAGGLGAAYASNQHMEKVTGGMGIFDILGGMWDQGTFDPSAVVDRYQNEQAKKDYESSGRGEEDRKLAAEAAAAQTAAAEALKGSSEKQSSAVDKLDKAADKMLLASNGQAPARTSQPLVAR